MCNSELPSEIDQEKRIRRQFIYWGSVESDTGKKAPYKKYVTKPATAVNNWSVIIQGNRPEHRIV